LSIKIAYKLAKYIKPAQTFIDFENNEKTS